MPTVVADFGCRGDDSQSPQKRTRPVPAISFSRHLRSGLRGHGRWRGIHSDKQRPDPPFFGSWLGRDGAYLRLFWSWHRRDVALLHARLDSPLDWATRTMVPLGSD